MNQYILAFETSSRVCDVALLSVEDPSSRLFLASHEESTEHAERLLPLARQLIDEAGICIADLTGVAFGQGPGGFTGLRVACGVAQGIAFALKLPVVPVPSLLAAAVSDNHDDFVRVVAQDARMNELYVAVYRTSAASVGGWSEWVAPMLVGVDDFSVWLGQTARQWTGDDTPGPIAIIGDALTAYPGMACPSKVQLADGLRSVRIGAPLRASAASVARLGHSLLTAGHHVSAAAAAPLYVRDKVAFTTNERENGMGGNPKAHTAIEIAPMTSDYLDAVADLEARVQSHPWTRGNFADALNAGYSAWVALSDNKVVGFCVVQSAPDVAHLLLIAVSPDYQRAGVGYRLLRQAESITRQAGLPALLLEVRPSNQTAVAFYTNRGFRQIGLRKGYYPCGHGQREDGLVLEKRLESGVS